MREWLIAVGLAFALALPVPAGAQGRGGESLDNLFEALSAAETVEEAAPIEARIWAVWYEYQGPVEGVRALMAQGMLAMEAGRLDHAEGVFDEIIERAPDYAEGWNRRATVRYMRGDISGSIADIAETLLREPRHFGALSGLGLCYVALEQPQHALVAFEMALEIHPNMPGAAVNAEVLRKLVEGTVL